MNRISGNILGLRIDGRSIDCEISCDISIDAEMRPATAPRNSGWRSFISGVKGWNVNLTGNLLEGVPERDVRYVIDAIINSKLVELDFLTGDFKFLLTGMALPSNVSITSTAGEDVSYTCAFQGTGKLSRSKVVWSQNGSNIVENGTGKLVQIQ